MVPLMSLQLVHPMPWIQSPAELFLMYQWTENTYVTGFLWIFRILMYVIYGFNLRYSFYLFLTVFLRIIYGFLLRIIYVFLLRIIHVFFLRIISVFFLHVFLRIIYVFLLRIIHVFFLRIISVFFLRVFLRIIYVFLLRIIHVFFYGLFTYAINQLIVYVYP